MLESPKSWVTFASWLKHAFLGDFDTHFLLHLFFDIVSLGFLLIFKSSNVHTVLSKVSKFYINETSSVVSFPHVIFHTICTNVSKFSIVVASTPCVVVPSKYSFYNLFCWIQYLGFGFRGLVSLFLALVTFTFKLRFLLAFTFSTTILISLVALSIEFSLSLLQNFFDVWHNLP